jgi:hypothetical protein
VRKTIYEWSEFQVITNIDDTVQDKSEVTKCTTSTLCSDHLEPEVSKRQGAQNWLINLLVGQLNKYIYHITYHIMSNTGIAAWGRVELRRQYQCWTSYAVIYYIVLLMMGLLIPETYWAKYNEKNPSVLHLVGSLTYLILRCGVTWTAICKRSTCFIHFAITCPK